MKSLYSFLTTKGQLAALILGVGSIALTLITIFGGLSSAGYDVGTDLNSILKDGGGDGFNFFNMGMTITMVLIGIAVAAWILFTLFQLLTNPKESMRIMIAMVIIAIMFFVFYSMSESETTGKIAQLIQKNNISEGVSRIISGGLKTTVYLAAISAIAMIVLEIYNLFK